MSNEQRTGAYDSPTLPDIERLAVVFDRHRVEYCVIGGIAARFYGSRRLTSDIDVLGRGGLENLTRLAAALDELGARVANRRIDADDLRGMNTRWETTAGRVDVLLAATGPGRTRVTYKDVAADVLIVQRDNIQLHMISVDDLVVLKRATNRPHDRVDLDYVLAAHPRLRAQPKPQPPTIK